MTTERLMLLDSASLYFRAFYGVPDERTSPDQQPVNAIRGFLDMIATLVNRHRPTHLAACWDEDWRPQWRVDLIPSYKTHRVAEAAAPGEEEVPDDLEVQVPIIAQCLAAIGIARVGAAHYEADDVIGTLVTRYRGVMPVDVVTGDRDLFQLVDDEAGVSVLYTARGGVRDPDVIGQRALQEKYAVPTGDAYVDLAVLRGDSSDGLPGVSGIGDKTAATLLATFGDLDGIRAALSSGDPRIKGAQRTRLEAGLPYLDVAPTVVRVARDIDLPDVDLRLPTTPVDAAALSRLAMEHGIANPLSRVADALAKT